MSLFPLVNRSVLLARPKQPFVDWLRKVAVELGEDELAEITIEDVQEDVTAFLIEAVDESDTEPAVALDWQDIFEESLLAWVEDADFWPEPLTRERFDEWFTVEIHSIAVDAGADDIEVEEPESQA